MNKRVVELQDQFPREFGSRNSSFEKVAQMKMHESRKAIQYTMVAGLLESAKKIIPLFGMSEDKARESRKALWNLIAGIHLIGGFTHLSPKPVIVQ